MISTRQKLTRYSGSLLLVLAVHAIAIIIAVRWPASQAIELPPAAMMVELAPLPEPAPPPPPKVVQPPPPPAPEEPEPMPEVAQAPKPEIVVPKKVEKPKPKPQPPKPQKKPEPPQEKPADEKPVDTPPTTAKPEKAAAPKPAPAPAPAPPSNALPSWQGDLLSHLGKYKKYPEDARRRGMQGVARLRFVVDADGNVLSYSIANSSGSPALDRATMEMIRRAQPLPKPPKEILNNGTIEILAPFVYSLDKR
ncbi:MULTISPECIES: energy transducer TonB [Pseudomonas]|uniref:Protein TonB n=4 Tax=Pseudomonas syringae group genomosp. 2 TaxID=251698 RepID=A0AAX1VRK0_PSEAJ|nr:energy transducer TonB [Pseudomonas amygdali]KPX72989.1 TonB protein [Pseudomonas amygdali pv. lachrymans]KPX84616.1 TonB protein [Pseudomonas amygdali pv. mori]KEZ26151.1 energy transducer TonB [Pseudomonas amygdali pv. tabaci str. 6605]KIY15988.1 energy transducer TonB [Pseudomonas amygdali pv. tabaci]KPY79560.1 TonB protein [Pseudomonas amygdali pv. tabaci]